LIGGQAAGASVQIVAWSASDRERLEPDVQRGWEIIGAMVKRRRLTIAWSQRDLERAAESTNQRSRASRTAGFLGFGSPGSPGW
jgi:hypothetical protein